MDKLQERAVIKSLLTDSLMARGGKTLTPEVINEIMTELLERLCELSDKEA